MSPHPADATPATSPVSSMTSDVPSQVVSRGRRYAILLTMAAAATSSQAFGRFTFSLLYTSVRDEFGLSNSRAGTLGSANLAAYLTGTFLVSILVGRVGLSRTTRIGLVGVTIGLGLLSWSPSYVVVFTGLVFTGLFAAGVWITVPAIVSMNVDPSRRGAALGMVGGAMGVGMFVASLLDSRIGESSWRLLYRGECLFALVTLGATLVLLRGQVDVRVPANGMAVIRAVRGWVRLLLVYAIFGWSMILIITFLVAVLKEDNGYTAAEASIAFSAVGLGTAVGGPVFGPLSDRIGRRPTLIAAFLVMAFAAIGIGWGGHPNATIATFVFGTAFTGVPTMIAAIISDSVEPSEFGGAYGVATLAFGVGLILAPMVGGVIADRTGSFHPVYIIAMMGSFVAAGLLARPIGVTLRR